MDFGGPSIRTPEPRIEPPRAPDLDRKLERIGRWRDWLERNPPRDDLGDVTERNYTAAFERMQDSGRTPDDLDTTKAGYYAARAAWKHGLKRALGNCIEGMDGMTPGEDDWRKTFKDAEHAARLLNPYSKNRDWRSTAEPSRWRDAPSRSKKHALDSLPPGWRDDFWSRAVLRADPLLPAFALLRVAGCRPEEIRKGVEVEHGAEGLTVRIKPCKTHGDRYGIGERELVFDPDSSPAARYLAGVADRCGGGARITVRGRYRLRDAVRDIDPALSPYCFRHQFAADVKKSGDPLLVAVALGHSSLETQRKYAGRRHGNPGHGIKDARHRGRMPKGR